MRCLHSRACRRSHPARRIDPGRRGGSFRSIPPDRGLRESGRQRAQRDHTDFRSAIGWRCALPGGRLNGLSRSRFRLALGEVPRKSKGLITNFRDAHDLETYASLENIRGNYFRATTRPFDDSEVFLDQSALTGESVLKTLPARTIALMSVWNPDKIFASSLRITHDSSANMVASEAASLTDRAISFGSFRLSPRQRLLLEAGKPVRVGSCALDLLIALAERPANSSARTS